jgi:hypothetical protein
MASLSSHGRFSISLQELALRTHDLNVFQNCQETYLSLSGYLPEDQSRCLSSPGPVDRSRVASVLVVVCVLVANRRPGPMIADLQVQSAQELVEGAVEALVQHYRDPIHEEEGEEEGKNDEDECGRGCRAADEGERPVPPVVAFQLQRLVAFGSVNAAMDSVRIRDVWRRLVEAYETHIRPTLFGSPPQRTAPAPRAAVVTHYQLLTRLYFQRNTNVLLLDPGMDPTSSGSSRLASLEADEADECEGDGDGDEPVLGAQGIDALERLACDVTLATAIEIRRKKGDKSRRHRNRQTNAPMDGEDGADNGRYDEEDDEEGELDRAATVRILAALARHMSCVLYATQRRRRRRRVDDDIARRGSTHAMAKQPGSRGAAVRLCSSVL